ncbi:hypothetical protein ETU08_01775 [Apibacter muscae]|uniref:DUF2586 family protein n=1 Tax=Apibacter muscae TaxID=2509004 RepID=UPI0011ADD8F8|nr:DUF2586 family protein [Apibacter muscae]TWP31234.1 hypothetical protein ETU08_01775 [Apibacter muscae]
MAQLTGVNVNKLQGGLGRGNGTTDSYVGLVGYISAETLALLPEIKENKALQLLQIEDLEAQGFNESFDANNKLLVHYHISEIFRLAPEAVVYFIPTTSESIEKAIEVIIPAIRENSEIKGLGFCGFSETLETLNVDAIQKTLVDEFTKENRDLDFVLLEGKPKAGETFKVNDLPNLREKAAPNITVIIGQDPAVASLEEAYKNYSAIGSALGMLAIRKISENMGSVNIENKPANSRATTSYPLTDSASSRWLSSALSDGTPLSELSKTHLKTIQQKGYVFIAGYEGFAGLFFSASTTCIEKASDFSTIENNRVWNAAKRAIRQSLLPYVKGKVKKDPSTGYIKSTTIATWHGAASKALEQMVINNDISGYQVRIDNNQVVNEDNPVKIRAVVVTDDIAHEFDVDLGLTNNIE